MQKKKIIEPLRCVFLTCVISFGLFSIIATGGGDSVNTDGNDDSCDYNVDIVCEEGCDKTCHENSGSPGDFMLFNDKLVFSAFEGCKNTSQQKLFEMDDSGNISGIIGSELMIEREKVILNNILYFILDGYLYKYDGSNQAEKIFPEYTESIFSVQNLMAYNNKIYFYYSAFGDEANLAGLYSYGGTGAPLFLGDVRADGNSAVYNGRLYFRGYTEDSGVELWCYDDSGPGLYMVADNNNAADSLPAPGYFNIVVFREKLFFNAEDDENGLGLWMIDDEQDPELIPASVLQIRPAAVFQDNLLCEMSDEQGDKKLYEYNGSELNPLFTDVPYDSHMWLYYGQDINTFAILNDHFYFLAVDTSEGFWNAQYLWDYDGETAPVKILSEDYITNMHLNSADLLLQGDNKIIRFDYEAGTLQVLFEAEELGLEMMYLQKAFSEKYFATGTSETDGSELWAIDAGGDINIVEDFYPGTSCDCECDD